MNIAIIFDSIFGNTAKIANAVAHQLERSGSVQLVPVSEARDFDPRPFDLIVLGSPTRGFRPTPAMSEFAEGLTKTDGKKAAVFDTRINLDDVHPAPLRWVVDAGGYAAQRLEGSLQNKGYALAAPSSGFVVTGTEGPLRDGELDRAAEWARALAA